MVAKLEPTAKGYGIVSQGSSTSAFLGTSQSFFLGGKQSTTVGAINSTTLGVTTSMSVGPSVNMSISPPWVKATGDEGTTQWANLFAKYDFSNNKSFAFHIAHEGSSAYTTQSKFMTSEGFQAVAGYQLEGRGIYKTYTDTIQDMCWLVLAVEVALAVETLMEVLFIPEKPSTLEMNLAKGIPATTNALASLYLAYKAISVAIQRESVFKAAIKPQSVFTLNPQRIFLGALGDVATQQQGTSLSLENGRATLGSRAISATSIADEAPFKSKFIDFKEGPTSSIAVDTWQIQQQASKKIALTAGVFPPDPTPDPVQIAIAAQNAAAQAAFDAVFFDLFLSMSRGEDATLGLAQDAYNVAFAAEQAGVDAVKAATAAENGPYMVNPSVLLRAIEGPASMVQAEAKIFNVKAPLITLQTDPLTLETGSISVDPAAIAIQVDPVTNMKLTLAGVEINAGPTARIVATPEGHALNSETSTVTITPAEVIIASPTITLMGDLVQVGAGLKVLG